VRGREREREREIIAFLFMCSINNIDMDKTAKLTNPSICINEKDPKRNIPIKNRRVSSVHE